MGKIKKDNKPKQKENQQHQKPGTKPQKPGQKVTNGIVKAKNKVMNGSPGKKNPAAPKADKVQVIKNQNQNKQKPAKGAKLQKNDIVAKNDLKEVKKPGKGPKPVHIKPEKREIKTEAAPKLHKSGKGPKPNPPQAEQAAVKVEAPSKKLKLPKGPTPPTAVKIAAPSKKMKLPKGPMPPTPESPEKNNRDNKKKKNKVPKTLAPPSPLDESPKETKRKNKEEAKAQEQARLESLPEFNQANFEKIVTRENIKKVAAALKKHVEEQCKKLKSKVFNDYKLFLNVACFKVPSCPKRIVKLRLKHSLISEDDDVCFFVRDMKRSNHDSEKTKEKYDDLLKAKGVTGVKTVIPFNQLKKEYGSYEMKIKLSNTYDAFLCDGAIVGHVVGFLGSKFRKTRCTPYPVRVNSDNLQQEIETAMRKTSYKQGQKGTMISITIGTNKMTTDQVTDNIVTVIGQLNELYPGGNENIRSMYLKINIMSTSALPIYMSLCRPPAKAPYIVGPKEEKMKKIKANAKEILTKFQMGNDGTITKSGPLGTAGQKRSAADVSADATSNKKIKKEAKQQNLVKIEPKAKKNAKVIKSEPVEPSESDDDSEEEVEVAPTVKKGKIVKQEPVESESDDESEPQGELASTIQRLLKRNVKQEDDSDDDDDDDEDDDDDAEDDDDDDDEDGDDDEDDDEDSD